MNYFTYPDSSIYYGTSNLFPVQNQTFFERANQLQALPSKKIICLGETAQLTAFGAGIDNLRWTGRNLNQLSGIPTFTGSTLGTFNFTVTGTSACTSATASTSITVVPPPPKPNLGPDFTACELATLAAPVTPGFRYLWSTGDTARVITVQPDTGTQQIILTLSNGGCERSDTINLKVLVKDDPSPLTVTGSTTRCQGDSVLLSALSNSYTHWLWSNGDTTAATWARTSGWYKVKSGRQGGCLSNWSDSVYLDFLPVFAPPVIDPSGTITACVGDTIRLRATVSSSRLPQFQWSGGATGPELKVTQNGSFRVRGDYGNPCPTDSSAPVTVTFVPKPPQPVITGIDTICPGGSTVLTAPAGYNFYRWTTTATSQSIVVNQPGFYSVTVGQNAGCFSAPAQTVQVVMVPPPAPPQIVLSADTICDQSSAIVQVVNANPRNLYIWNTGDTGTTLTVNRMGWYKVRTVAPFSGCASPWSDSVFLFTEFPPQVSRINGPTRICPGQQQVRYWLAASGARIIWQVRGGSLVSSDPTEATINWGVSGTGNIRVIAATNGPCANDTLDFPVTINRLLTPLAPEGSPLVCDKAKPQLYEVPLADQQPGSSYVWNISNGQIISQSGFQALVQWNGSGTVSFTQTITADSVCTGTSPAIAVEVLEPITISYPATLCQGDSIRASVSSPSNWSYRWSYQNSIMTGNTFAELAADSGAQPLQLNYSYGGCSLDTVLAIQVYPKPAPALQSGPTAVCPNELSQSVYQFRGLNNSSWQYSVLGGSILSTLNNQVLISWNESAPLHQITITETSAEGCVSEPFILPVAITPNPGLPASGCDPELFPLSIPNVLTPNGDGYNDRLEIRNLRYYGNCALTLTNRWGQTVYSSPSYANDFDGEDLPAAVYFYQLSAGRVYKGWLQVVR